MRKLLMALCIISLAFAGCGREQTADETVLTTTETAPRGCYVPKHPIQTQTQGAVWVYQPEQDAITNIMAIGDRLLLQTDTDTLTVLADNEGLTVASANLAVSDLQSTYEGVAYFDGQTNQTVFLDSQLQELERIDMPQGITANPVVKADGSEIYYCLGQDVFGLDRELGISRKIKTQTCTEQAVIGCYFDGKVLATQVRTEDGQTNTVYFSGENGKTLQVENGISLLATYENNYFTQRTAGIIKQQILGTLDGAALSFTAEDTVLPALELGGLVQYYLGEDGQLNLNFYDSTTNVRTSGVTFDNPGAIVDAYGDRWSGCVWLLTQDEEDNQLLIRWNVRNSQIAEETVYTGVLFTAQNPDREGLKQCQDRINAMNRAYGVRIRIWEDAARHVNGHSVVPEHIPEAINACLDELEMVFLQLPDRFLYKTVTSEIRICIVRSVDGKQDATQFWYDGDAFILLCPGVRVSDVLIRELGYVVNSHILGNSPIVDAWPGMNPEGFAYGNADTYSDAFLIGESRAFVDKESMESVTEDRSRIFWQAMQPDNSQLFQSPIMQAKLKQLCLGIRDAWRWEKKAEVYPWEQYLAESIAPQE